MTHFVSTKGGVAPADFEKAVLQGYAADGGLFVPEVIPQVAPEKLQQWSRLNFEDLAFEILSLFIDRSIISADELKLLLHNSFKLFEHPQVVPVVPLDTRRGLYVMELFHGPTLSFKDMAMGFMVNCVDFFLQRKDSRVSLLVATTGDTGPAAAHASAGKQTIDCWVLYPRGMISEEQERQMTTLEAPNVHAVGVNGCPNGGDDLDSVITQMFADEDLKKRLQLSSVNSINWCRVMVQTVHYFFGYFRVVDKVGERVIFSVPSGAFGNLFGGYLARTMGLPIETFVCANNDNATLHRIFSTGKFEKKDLKQTVSSAIDIVIPYNFWRYLYFTSGCDHNKIRQWMRDFQDHGGVQLDPHTTSEVKKGFISTSIPDEQTISTMASVYKDHGGYLLDPHAAVAVAAADKLSSEFNPDMKVVCLATAHPAKFPDAIRKALALDGPLPEGAKHKSIEAAKNLFQRCRSCDCTQLTHALHHAMESVAKLRTM
jgi:threonine synthase